MQPHHKPKTVIYATHLEHVIKGMTRRQPSIMRHRAPSLQTRASHVSLPALMMAELLHPTSRSPKNRATWHQRTSS